VSRFASQPSATSSSVFFKFLVSPPVSNWRFAGHRSGGDDGTHRRVVRPHLAYQQQEKSEGRFSVALGISGVSKVRPNHLAQGEPQRRGTLGLRRSAFGLFCAAVPARHTVGATLARTLGHTKTGPLPSVATTYTCLVEGLAA
jgi:hypothetical protein